MTRHEKAHQMEISRWLASRFDGKESASIRVDLKAGRLEDGVFLRLDNEQVRKLASRFRNEINQYCFGNAARRYGKELPVTFTFHPEPQPHLHILVGLGNRIAMAELSKLTEKFCTKNCWVKSSFYFDETRSNEAAQMYNSRNGADSVVIF